MTTLLETINAVLGSMQGCTTTCDITDDSDQWRDTDVIQEVTFSVIMPGTFALPKEIIAFQKDLAQKIGTLPDYQSELRAIEHGLPGCLQYSEVLFALSYRPVAIPVADDEYTPEVIPIVKDRELVRIIRIKIFGCEAFATRHRD